MFRLKNIWFLILFFNLHVTGYSQQKNTASYVPIFEDLPIDDPAENSILHAHETAEEKINKNIFVTATLNKNRCYLGEPILLTYQLLSSLQSNSTVKKMPALFGFITTEIETDNEVPAYRTKNGKKYRIFNIQRYQLIPIQQGKLDIEPIVIQNTVHYQKNGKTHQYAGLASGQALNIIVMPLPEKGKPNNFSGLIGTFQLSASVKSNTIPAGENNTLHIEIKGEGNFKNFSLPEIKWPDEFEHFSPTDSLITDDNVFPSAGKKTIDIPFIIKKEGSYTIPALSLSYFNPAKGIYQTIHSIPISINVLPALSKPFIVRQTIVEKRPYIPLYVWIILVAAVGVIAFLLLYVKRNLKNTASHSVAINPEIEPSISIPAEKNIEEYLHDIDTLKHLKNQSEYVGGLKRLLLEFLQHKLHLPDAKEEELFQKIELSSKNYAAEIYQWISECNYLLYSAGSLNSEVRNSMASKLAAIIEKGNAQLI